MSFKKTLNCASSSPLYAPEAEGVVPKSRWRLGLNRARPKEFSEEFHEVYSPSLPPANPQTTQVS